MKRALCVCVLLAAAGCSTTSDTLWLPDDRLSDAPARRLHDHPHTSRHTDVASNHEAGASTVSAPAVVIADDGSLTLRDAIAAALRANPELASFAYDVRAAEAAVVQAGFWPNPELELELENFAGSGEFEGVEELEVTLALSQTFPLGGDIERRKALARIQGQRINWDYEAARVSLLAEVTRRYVDVLVAQRQVELAGDAQTLTEQVADSIGRRIDAGDAPAVERPRAALPVAIARIAKMKAQQSLESARVQLAMSWGHVTPTFASVRGELERIAPLPPPSAIASLISDHPDVARWVTEVASRQAEIELARAQATPDLTASLGFRWFHASDDVALAAGVSIPLPVFDRGQGDILAARFGVKSAKLRQRAVELRLEAALAAAYARLANALAEATALRDEALPPAAQAYQSIRLAFDQGNLGFLDVLDAERTLIELKQQYLDALAAYHIGVAEIEGFIGQPLHDIQAKPADPNPSNTDAAAPLAAPSDNL